MAKQVLKRDKLAITKSQYSIIPIKNPVGANPFREQHIGAETPYSNDLIDNNHSPHKLSPTQ